MLTPLDRSFNAAVLHIAGRLLPCGFDVGADAPSTLQALKDHYATTRRIKVWDGASEQTIFGDREVNYAFRAWHDWCHLTGNLQFTTEGKRRAAVMQCDHLTKLYGMDKRTAAWHQIVRVEVIDQAEEFERTGEFVQDQRAFDVSRLHQAGLYLNRL